MKGTKGFTLIEVLVAVIVAAILLSVAIPTYLDTSERNSIATTSNELLAAVLLARSEAIRQEQPTTITPNSTGWQVDTGALNLVNHTVDSDFVSINGNAITYNARGRAALNNTTSMSISFDGEVKSRICLSLTGRPFIRLAEDGVCP
ncbi:MAG: GspH/FimT family pseudopilin [Candidatus Thiodiazotropha lotti]|nr:GspH/FimT family pseudopilin [Candidatus Thiodiazotropha lotti]MCG7930853.1 GspH/FimT family pseudopilin [Candidatus Thiodiazotropha lotti]MCG8005368.1 GspH/FimT family pseudopilin [Candidatus Thiodiazotropha lotti]MCG8008489.1 GspH/FimT family pseudopilin [Candidatus Thiodiazotropha lotti]MCW4188995.1 GspH/FimT family pseudopilin [Candidatus Thiodiazotropha lotti]